MSVENSYSSPAITPKPAVILSAAVKFFLAGGRFKIRVAFVRSFLR
jgi:hypothetical protein